MSKKHKTQTRGVYHKQPQRHGHPSGYGNTAVKAEADQGRKFYISDLHLYDPKNTMLRGFAEGEMEECIRENWNRAVRKDDTVFVVGDAAFVGLNREEELLPEFRLYMESLNGHKILVTGNHDRFNVSKPVFRDAFDRILSRKEIMDGNDRIFLDHFPMEDWPGINRGELHIHGHNHEGTVRNMPNRFNVSANLVGYTPRTLAELKAMKEEKEAEHDQT